MSQPSTEQVERTFRPLSTRIAWRFCLAWVAFFLSNGVAHAAPSPPAEQIILEDFERYRDTTDLRKGLSGGHDAGDASPSRPVDWGAPLATVTLDREMPPGERTSLRAHLPGGDRARWTVFHATPHERIPENWTSYGTFTCMSRSLAEGAEGKPLARVGEIHDLGDYLYLEIEARDRRTGRWRRTALRDERNRRYLSWSGWSRWQVDLTGDSSARNVDWSRIGAFRVAAAGAASLPVFVYLDDCRLERAWNPVQSEEYFFLGVNIWDLWGRGDGPYTGMKLREPFDATLKANIEEKLAYLARKRIPILRVFIDYHFEVDPGRGIFEDELLRRLDFVIDTIRANDWPIRLIISHSTGYDLQTGISWYAGQAGGAHPYEKVRAFYTSPRLREAYKRQLRYVLEHRNPSTGVAWKDEPVIWAWDVSNEPRILYGTPGTTYASRTRDMVAWYEEMSRTLRKLDSRHRIISGTFYSGDGLEPHHEDYDDWNIWELFSVESIDAISVQSYVGPHLLKTGPKPVLLEEFGYGGPYFEDPSDEKRANNYRWMLLSDDKVYLSGVGALLWQLNWNHGYPDGKEIHSIPPSHEFVFSPDARNSSLDVFEFYLAKYNHLEVEPEVEEGWSDLGGVRWHWRSINPPLVGVEGRRFGEGYVTTPGGSSPEGSRGRLRDLSDLLKFRLGFRGKIENRIFIPAAGPYQIEAWVRGSPRRAGKFRLRIDEGPPRLFETPSGSSGSRWHLVRLEPPFNLAYGNHLVRIELLSSGAALNRYRFVPAAAADHPPTGDPSPVRGGHPFLKFPPGRADVN